MGLELSLYHRRMLIRHITHRRDEQYPSQSQLQYRHLKGIFAYNETRE